MSLRFISVKKCKWSQILNMPFLFIPHAYMLTIPNLPWLLEGLCNLKYAKNPF